MTVRSSQSAPRARCRNGRRSLAACAAVALVSMLGCEGRLDHAPSGPRGVSRVPPEQLPLVPAPPMLHRLTRAEYEQTLRDLFPAGLTIPSDLPDDTLLHGFTTVGASEMTIPPLDLEQYEAAANDVARQVVSDPARRAAVFGCDVAVDGDGCVRSFLVSFGQRAWRRTLQPTEIDQLASIARDTGTLLRDPWRGAGFALSALLLSPHFLFRVEIGEPDPASRDRLRFTSWEMASRLSYFLWGTTPDAELLRAAAANELVTDEGLRTQMERMLGARGEAGDPRSRTAMTRFWFEFMQLERLESVSKDPELFPTFDAALRTAMREEAESIFEDVYARDVDIREVFSTDVTFVDSALAAHYGLPDPGPGMRVRTRLPASARRGGVMGRAGVLSMWAHSTLTSPTLRGKFIRANLLCQDIAPPPPGITTELPEPSGEPQTLRQRLDRHATDPVCAACHVQMDPLGFSLEHFDPVGRWRDLDEGLPIDATAVLDGTPVDGAEDLGAFLASSERVGDCFARRFYRWSSAHLETRGELPELTRIQRQFAESGHRLRDLVSIVVLSPAFRYASYTAGDCTEGETRDCSNACGAGTQTCERRGSEGSAWTACGAPTGTDEQCNGADDDCDGTADEGVSRACTTECGAGVESCVAGAFGACSARVPSTEVCSHTDDDCDGRIDEGFGAMGFAGTYSALREHHPLCDGSAQRIGLECNMAIHGLCSTAAGTCGTSGFGPVESSGDAAHVGCVTATLRVTSYAELATHHDGCNGTTQRVGAQCNAAIHRYCASAGLTTGFGPVQVSGDAVTVSCVPSAEVLGVTYAEMTARHDGCTAATRIGGPCNAAIHRHCTARGASSGFGPIEGAGDTLSIACVRP